MGTKEKKTVAELVTLIMDKIREYPEYDHIAKVVVTRRIPRISGHANWTVEWSVIGNWSVPEGAYKIAERLCAQFDSLARKISQGLLGMKLSAPLIEEVRFAADSPVEGEGFELSVPRVMGGRFRTTVPAAIAVFEVAGTAVALPRHQGGWPGPSSRIPR